MKNLLIAPFRNKAKQEVADLFIYGDIGPYDDCGQVSAKSVVTALKEIGAVSNLNVRINSVGGDVFEGIAIYQLLAKHPANVTVQIDSVAASIASIIAMAGKKVKIADNGTLMIHNPTRGAYGDEHEFARALKMLQGAKATLVDTYRRRVTADRDKISAWMNDETWFSPSEAKKHGFVDEIVDTGVDKSEPAEMDNRSIVLLAGYKKTPKDLLPDKHLAAKAKLASMVMMSRFGGQSASA